MESNPSSAPIIVIEPESPASFERSSPLLSVLLSAQDNLDGAGIGGPLEDVIGRDHVV